mgnify:CR=1 FL=1
MASNQQLYNRLSKKEKRYLKELYLDSTKVGSLGTPYSLYKLVKKEGKYKNLTLSEIKSFLSSLDVYTVFKQVKVPKKSQGPKLYASKIDSIWQGDLLHFNDKYKKFNNGFVAILLVLDVFSRFCWFAKLKSTNADDLIKGFKEILQNAKPRKCDSFTSDMGTNFTSKKFKEFLYNQGIKQIVLNAPSKAYYVERFFRFLQEKLHKIFYHNQSYAWEPYISDIINEKNNTYHYGLKFIPSEVNKENEAELFYKQYLPPDKPKKKKKKKVLIPNKLIPAKFKVGQKVRILAHRYAFRHGYEENFTEEHFFVKKVYYRGIRPVYILEDVEKQPIKGAFYQYELQEIIIPPGYHYKIDKILKYKTMNKKRYALIQWYGFREKSWIPAEQIKDYKDTK